MDWRKLEQEIVEFFRGQDCEPFKPGGWQTTEFCGDWIIRRDGKAISLSELARELAANN